MRMPKHAPIYFADQGFSAEEKSTLKRFIKNHPKATSITKALLALAILNGALTLAAAVPGLIKIAGYGRKTGRSREYEQYRKLWARFNALKKRNIFELIDENKDGGMVYRFTKNGKITAKKFLLDTLELKHPKEWDGKWHVVVFDIPEKYKKARYALYHKLKDLDFYQLQKSVWIHPFACEAEINFLEDVFDIHPFVEVLIAENISNGKAIYYFKNLLKKYV